MIDRGSPRAAVSTPALVIDLEALEENIAAMAAAAASWGVQLRPHAKSHKCIAIALRQIAAGAVGISCATLDEVAGMVKGSIPGILLTSPIAGEPKLRQLGDLLRQDPTITAVVDDPLMVTELSQLSSSMGVQLRLLVDFETGQHRTGCRTVAAAVALAKQIQAAPGLEFAGVQCYAGHLQHITAVSERAAAANAVSEHLRSLCGALTQEQLRPGIVTGAGTGSAQIDGCSGVYTELQPGSYVFMDAEYLSVEPLDTRYRPSLFVDTTVVSTQWDSHVTTDAGTKAFALNGPPPRSAAREAGWTYSYAGDEFGRLTLDAGARRPALGERLAFIVSHCDPTVVLYPQFVCVRKDKIEDCWPIVPRHPAANASA